MHSKTMVALIVAVVISAGGLAVYEFHSNMIASSSHTSAQNNDTTQQKPGLKLLNYDVYFAKRFYKWDTYVRLKFSHYLIKDDFISLSNKNGEISRWWVNDTQAYNSTISFPLKQITNLNGNASLLVMRGSKTLLHTDLSFKQTPDFDVDVSADFNPLNYTKAEVKTISISVNNGTPVFVNEVKYEVNGQKGENAINSILWDWDYFKLSLYDILPKGNNTINLTFVCPNALGKDLVFTTTANFTINYTCEYPKINGFYISYWDETPYLNLNFSKNITCPLDVSIIASNGTDLFDYEISNGNKTDFAFPRHYNFNNTYTAVLKDYFGNRIQTYNISVHSGPLEMLNHTDYIYYYDWENITNFYDLTLTLKNTGNAMTFITHSNLTIVCSTNHTTIYNKNPWIYQTINPSESANITLYPDINIQQNQSYIVTIRLWGDNEDVQFVFSYEIKTIDKS